MQTQLFSMKTLPPTLNDIIASSRNNRFGDASIKKRWTKKVGEAAVAQNLFSVYGEVYLEFVWRVKNRRRDQDNICAAQKYILDGLVQAEILADDNLGVIMTPVIHHVVITDHDGFSVFIRDREAWEQRLAQGIGTPPAVDLSGIEDEETSGSKSRTPRSRQRGRTTTKETAKLLSVKRVVRRRRRTTKRR